MQREKRLAKILEIVGNREIETQEELCAALNAENFPVTQATVSRDIRALRLVKVSGAERKYRYALPEGGERKEPAAGAPALSEKLHNLFRESVTSICPACNLVVIKTISGNASNAGLVLDMLNYDEVVGTVAGDDTLFAACSSEKDALRIVERLNRILE